VDIQKQLKQTDPDNNSEDLDLVREGTTKLKAIADSIDMIQNQNSLLPKIANIAVKIAKKVRLIHKNIVKNKLGIEL